MSHSIRTGVVGYGLAGRVFHAPFVQAVPQLELAAIVQRSGNEAALAYPQAKCFRSFDDLLRSDVELVVIATPNDQHVSMARAALEAGKHVVVDKPLAPSVPEAEQLQDLARKEQRLLIPFHNRRWDGDFLTLQSILQKNELGAPVSLHSRFDRYRPLVREGSWKEAGGDANGILMDLGPHVIDQAFALFGEPETLTASVRRERAGTETDDAFELTLSYGRLQVHLGATLLALEAGPRYAAHGTRGSYVKFGVDPQEPAIVGGASVPALESNTPWLPEGVSQWGTLTLAPDPAQPKQFTRVTVPTRPGDYRGFYLNVAAAILGEAAPAVTPQDAIRVARTIALARESSRRGCTLPWKAAEEKL